MTTIIWKDTVGTKTSQEVARMDGVDILSVCSRHNYDAGELGIMPASLVNMIFMEMQDRHDDLSEAEVVALQTASNLCVQHPDATLVLV